jgi:hypothetical protein
MFCAVEGLAQFHPDEILPCPKATVAAKQTTLNNNIDLRMIRLLRSFFAGTEYTPEQEGLAILNAPEGIEFR